MDANYWAQFRRDMRKKRPRSLCLKRGPNVCGLRNNSARKQTKNKIQGRTSTPASINGSTNLTGFKGKPVVLFVQGALGMGLGIGFGLGLGAGVSNVLLTSTSEDASLGSVSAPDDVQSKNKIRKALSRFKPFSHRNVTDVLIQLNTLTFLLQKLSGGWVSAWGCKHNPAIARGQLWRLLTPSLLHGNLIHLMVNCYSLNHIGPKTEALFGGKRMLAVYVLSGISGNVYSYFFNRLPAVGSSGALFGLLGALGYFYHTHRKVLAHQVDAPLRSLRNVILTNLLLGMSTPNIDNWAHIGGMLAGAASVGLLGPRLSIEGTKGSLTDPPYLVDKPLLPFLSSKPLPLS